MDEAESPLISAYSEPEKGAGQKSRQCRGGGGGLGER